MENEITLTNLKIILAPPAPPEKPYTLMTLQGELIIDSISSIIDKLDNYYVDDYGDTIVDFAQLSFVNSIGLTLLVAILKKIQKVGKTLLFINPTKFIKDMITITELGNKLIIMESLEEAVAYLKSINDGGS